jgi:hypothetical protein
MKVAPNSSIYWFFRQMRSKYSDIEERFLWWVSATPERFKRILLHFTSFKTIFRPLHIDNWFTVLVIYIIELLGITEIYEVLSSFVKFNTRPLTENEMAIALSVFGEAINYEAIRMDEYAYFGPKQMNIAYVSFHTINSWGALSKSVFIHELMHVWQYERMGAVYMPLALAAQRTAMGYNYGGVEMLWANAEQGLKAFNLEQQADIIADYYRISHDFQPRWGRGTKKDLPIYEKYVQQVRDKIL